MQSLSEIMFQPLPLGLPTWTIAMVGSVVFLLYATRQALLPKPIPGIPYNQESAKRVLGDIPGFMETESRTGRSRLFFTELTKKHNSPVVQFFMGPFLKPIVVLEDYRETRDLILRREREIDRGSRNSQSWRGVVTDHHIAMDSSDHRFKGNRELIKDLMTPQFLGNVSAPEIYAKVKIFVKLWQFKNKMADGRAFEAGSDLELLTSDATLAAALAITEEQSDTFMHLQYLQSAKLPSGDPSKTENPFEFPRNTPSDVLSLLLASTDAVGKSFTAPYVKMFWTFESLRPSFIKTMHEKERLMRKYIELAGASLDADPERSPRCAVDYIVQREYTAAKKAGVLPQFYTPRTRDELFGYLLGAVDTTHTTLSFLVKCLGRHQREQALLRDALHAAHPQALASKRTPTVGEILGKPVPYLEGFFWEVLRLYGPIEGIFRETTTDIILLGYAIPKGTTIFLPLRGASVIRDDYGVRESLRSESSQKHTEIPNAWDESGYSAEDFNPERWLDKVDGETVFDIRSGPALSFSAGKRQCFGRRLAEMELKLVITILVWSFEFLPLPADVDDWGVHDGLLLKPDKCHVKLRNLI